MNEAAATTDTPATNAALYARDVPPDDPAPVAAEEAAPDPEPAQPPQADDGAEAASSPAEEEAPKKDEPEEKPDPAAQETALYKMLRKKEAKLVEREQRHARERSELQAQRQAFEQSIAQARASVEKANEVARRVADDPIGWALENGWDSQRIAARLLNDNKPTDRDRESAVEKRLAELQAKLDARERQEREAQETAQQQQVRERAERAFVDSANALADKHPTISALYADDVPGLIAEAHRVADVLRARGEPVTHASILAQIEKTEAAKLAKLKRPVQSGTAAASAADKGPEQAARQEHPGTKAPTLSGKTAVQRATLAKDPTEMTPDEERAHVLAMAEAARAARKSA